MSGWTRCSDGLPPFEKYVLARYNRDNWFDSRDQENVKVVVAMRVKAEVQGNNRLPFEWHTFGPNKFFGQEISEWALIPPRNDP